MGLTLLQSTNPITYELCQPGDGAVYNAYLCTPPRQYREEIQSILGFYYDSNLDEFILLTQMWFAAWPSWRLNAYRIHPETGLTTSQQLGIVTSGIFFNRSYENGQFKKVYANRFAGSGFNSIVPVDPVTFEVDIANPIVTNSDVGGFIMNKFVLNRQDGIVALGDVSEIRRYDYNTPVRLTSITIPEWTVEDLAYEDEKRAWALVSTAGSGEGLAAVKFNYFNPAVEILTELESVGTEIASAIAYDSKRKTIAVFRNMPVASDGASLDKLDIYKPIVVPTNLTAPVPTSKLVPGKTVTMVANLIGDRGEAGTLKPITITNTGDGTILQPTVTAKSNGSIEFQYLCGANPGTDVITLSVDI